MIKSAVQNGLRYIDDHPKRGLRNLVDLGEYFATGKFQKDFFDLAHDILDNNNSTYYQLIESMVKNSDHNILADFGVNLGYNSFTKGAKIIRLHEDECGYNVPWSITFNFRESSENNLTIDEISEFISSCKQIGIYSYIFVLDKNSCILEGLMKTIDTFKDCAFILFLDSGVMTDENIAKFSRTNILYVMHDNRTGEEKSDGLFLNRLESMRKNKMFFGLYKYYNDNNLDYIFSGKYIDDLRVTESTFVILIKEKDCSFDKQKMIYEYVVNSRIKENSPVFMIDFYGDVEKIDKIISSDSCFLSVDNSGRVKTCNLYSEPTEYKYNIRISSIEHILSNSVQKENSKK
jgi:hypothetical protein